MVSPNCISQSMEPVIHSWPSIFTGSASMDSTNCGLIFRKKCFVVTDMYYVVRNMMVVSVLNRCRYLSCQYPLSSTI